MRRTPLGVQRIAIGVNKKDCDVAKYEQARYGETANETKNMLINVGWKKDFIEKNTPILPLRTDLAGRRTS